ncbi:hypothetical protein [Acrocarpospora sp. B8E8]|uniref:hypothetical protein n=1 Tax=Acrocarpospora sp. B8E8 TaxID=3153572 RepID=UPI00325F7515
MLPSLGAGASSGYWLRAALVTAAMACAKTTGTFLGDATGGSAAGAARRMIAIGRAILEIAYRLIADPTLRFHDLGADRYDTLSPESQTRNKIRDLERLSPGRKVTLVPIHTAPA